MEDTMPDYPATTLALNKGKYYVLLTIPPQLRSHFSGRRQLKRSTGTRDHGDARRRQHVISSEMYAELDSCKPDVRDVISDLLGWVGDAKEVQRMDDIGALEGLILHIKHLEYGDNPEDDLAADVAAEDGAKAFELYRQWKAEKSAAPKTAGRMLLSDVNREYLAAEPYDLVKTTRDAELALKQFMKFAGDIEISDVSAVLAHGFSEHLGSKLGRKTVEKKVSFVKRMIDHAVRKGWTASNPLSGIVLDRRVGKPKQSYIPLSTKELTELFALEMDEHLRRLLSILVTSGMRLDEAALLNWEDIKAEGSITYFDLTSSIVKNKGSQRKVPVHPRLTWAVTGKSGQVFPQFTRDRDGKTQAAASKALMPLIRKVTKDRAKVVHSLRGNVKDMLRDAGISKEVNDFITGHSSGDVAGTYGSGPSLLTRRDALERLVFPFL